VSELQSKYTLANLGSEIIQFPIAQTDSHWQPWEAIQ